VDLVASDVYGRKGGAKEGSQKPLPARALGTMSLSLLKTCDVIISNPCDSCCQESRAKTHHVTISHLHHHIIVGYIKQRDNDGGEVKASKEDAGGRLRSGGNFSYRSIYMAMPKKGVVQRRERRQGEGQKTKL
jgi:hypothetical protein